jgi:hypothetical protein
MPILEESRGMTSFKSISQSTIFSLLEFENCPWMVKRFASCSLLQENNRRMRKMKQLLVFTFQN